VENALATVQGLVAAYGLKIIAAIAIFVLGKWLARMLSRGLAGVMTKAGTDWPRSISSGYRPRPSSPFSVPQAWP
jgi:hypothetical protein